MKKITLVLLSIVVLANSVFAANASKLVQKTDIKEIYYNYESHSYQFTKPEADDDLVTNSEKTIYVKIRKSDLDLLRREAFVTKDILDRLSDLEKLYRSIKTIVEGIVTTIDIVKKVLNITGIPTTTQTTDANKVELPSGMILTPGFVEYKAKIYDPTKTFDGLGLKALDFDVYYNKNLFAIDHIEGDGVYGNQFKFISLPQSSSTSKDRIQIPVSAVLTKEVSFQIYFVPRNSELAKTGDNSEIEIKDYKRPIKDPNGNYVSQVVFELGLNSPDFIKITKK